MREIKFRVYDNQRNRYMKGHEVLRCQCMGLSFGTKDVYFGTNGEELIRFTFEQFTGLKDQKDKDIYENDIVEVEVSRPKKKDDYQPFKTKQRWTVEHVDHLTHTGFEFYGDDRRFHISMSKSKIFNNKVVVVSDIHKEIK